MSTNRLLQPPLSAPELAPEAVATLYLQAAKAANEEAVRLRALAKSLSVGEHRASFDYDFLQVVLKTFKFNNIDSIHCALVQGCTAHATELSQQASKWAQRAVELLSPPSEQTPLPPPGQLSTVDRPEEKGFQVIGEVVTQSFTNIPHERRLHP